MGYSQKVPYAMIAQAASEFVINGFVPTVTFAMHEHGMQSTACVYNYFSELYPDCRSGATVNAWAFTADGECLGHVQERVSFRGQTRIPSNRFGRDFFGSIAVSLVPDEPPAKRPCGVGTGYYVQYRDASGRVDHSHEWDPMRFSPYKSVPWLCVIRPKFGNTQLVVLNSYFGADAAEGIARFTVRLRDRNGSVLEECGGLTIPSRGCWATDLAKQFPLLTDFSEYGPLAIEVAGENIMGPFTLVRSPGGDFNVHHFC